MDIKVKFNEKYKEVIVSDGNARIETGLLDEKEQKELGLAFLSAATELLED